MTLYEFNRTGGPALSEDSQADYWASEGHYLVQRYEDECRIGLYALDSFFVEACRAAGAV